MRLYLQMTVMNGYEATKAIRRSSHELAKTIPIIAMTANAFKYFFKYPLGIEINLKGKRLIFRYDRKIPDYFSVAGAP